MVRHQIDGRRGARRHSRAAGSYTSAKADAAAHLSTALVMIAVWKLITSCERQGRFSPRFPPLAV